MAELDTSQRDSQVAPRPGPETAPAGPRQGGADQGGPGAVPDSVRQQGNQAVNQYVSTQLAQGPGDAGAMAVPSTSAAGAAPTAPTPGTAASQTTPAPAQAPQTTPTTDPNQPGTTPYQIPTGVRNEHIFGYIARDIIDSVPPEQRAYAQEAVPQILRQAAELNVRDPNQVAYMLATAQHESRFGAPRFARSESMVEDHNPYSQQRNGQWSATVHTNGRSVQGADPNALDTAYWDSAYGNRLGNRPGTTDGQDFKGRGFVQLTGRDNYRNTSDRMNAQGFSYAEGGQRYGGAGNPSVDLTTNPTHMNQNKTVAARALVDGMQSGSFTTQRLDRYINDQQQDFVNARRVVNGDTAQNGAHVAGMARGYVSKVDQYGSWNDMFYPPRTTYGGPR
jgi:predicted chitinase